MLENMNKRLNDYGYMIVRFANDGGYILMQTNYQDSDWYASAQDAYDAALIKISQNA